MKKTLVRETDSFVTGPFAKRLWHQEFEEVDFDERIFGNRFLQEFFFVARKTLIK